MVLEPKPHEKNKITAINSWAVVIFRYWAEMLQQTESKLKDVGKKSKKTKAMHGKLHPKSIWTDCTQRGKMGGRDLMSVECCVREEKNSLEFYVTNSGWNVLRGVAAAETSNVEVTVMSKEFEKQNAQELKQNLIE